MENWESLMLVLQTLCVTHQLHGLLSDAVRSFYMHDIFVCKQLEFKNAIQLGKNCIKITYAKILKSDKMGQNF